MIKILWIVNVPLPAVCRWKGIEGIYGGGWLQGILKELSKEKELEITIATPYNCVDYEEISEDGVNYLLVPGGEQSKKRSEPNFIMIWKKVLNRIKPRLIHCFGTEYAHVLSAIDANEGIPLVVSIQGLVSIYEKYYYGGMKFNDIISHYTLKDFLRKTGIFYGRREMKRRGELEQSILIKAGAVIGRTDWDRAHVAAVNPKADYYYNNETLRNGFYLADKWDLDEVERNSIFVSQATYPIKGFHKLLEALRILKNNGLHFTVYVSGSNIYGDLHHNNLRDNGYVRYVKDKVRKYGLTEQITFLGALNEEEMIRRYRKSHVFVSPSAIENSPNSVGEAMILGVPIISSFVGGVSSILSMEEGLLYPYEESAVLAHYIQRILTDDQLAEDLSKKEIKRAEINYNRENNRRELTAIYYKLKEVSGNAEENDL